jgi:hypothetical protein
LGDGVGNCLIEPAGAAIAGEAPSRRPTIASDAALPVAHPQREGLPPSVGLFSGGTCVIWADTLARIRHTGHGTKPVNAYVQRMV